MDFQRVVRCHRTIKVAFGIVDLFCLGYQIIFSLFMKVLYGFLSQLATLTFRWESHIHRIRAVQIRRDLWSPASLPKAAESTRAGCSGCFQWGFEYLQQWRLHNLSGQSIPAFHHTHHKKKFFCYALLEFPVYILLEHCIARASKIFCRLNYFMKSQVQ